MAKKKIIKVGDVFGKWTVTGEEYHRIYPSGKSQVLDVVCECGSTSTVNKHQLMNGASTQCMGCKGISERNLNVGDVFDKLTVLRYAVDNGRRVIFCECVCGNTKKTLASDLVRNKTNSCGCSHKGNWQGVGDLSQSYMGGLQKGAETRKLIFSVTKEELWKLFQKQKGLCALSGLAIEFPKTKGVSGTASVDRIDSYEGYVLHNVQWVHKNINMMKNKLDERSFIALCKHVAEYN